VQVEATHVEIVDGNAIFKNGEAVNAIFSLSSFLWSPLGKTPPFVKMPPFDLKSLGELSPHSFHYNATVDSHSSHVEIRVEARAVIADRDTFFFVDNQGDFVYHLPIRHTCFVPLGYTVPNMKHWRREAVANGVTGIAGVSGSSGTSGVSGSSGSSGVSGSSGTSWSGYSGSPGLASSGTSGKSFNWQGQWKETEFYSAGDVVSDGKHLWYAVEGNTQKVPIENLKCWDVMISAPNLENRELSLKYSLTAQELRTLKSSPLTVLRVNVDNPVDIVSATLITLGSKRPFETRSISLAIGNTIVGGWADLKDSEEILSHKAEIFGGYSSSVGQSVVLKADKDADGESDAILYLTYRVFDTKFTSSLPHV
jgi:hypothetical protein